MIKWKLIALPKDSEEVVYDLLSLDYCSLKETDSIQFQVSVDNDSFASLGEPYITIGDIPLEMELHHYANNDRVFFTSEALGTHSSRYFYNFFGESEIGLAFEKEESYYRAVTVDILARKENAQLANEMLEFITDNLEDAISVCFSRSKIPGVHDNADSFHFTKLEIVEKAIKYISDSLPMFFREHKHTWKPEMQLSDRGQPTGPDSVYWVLSHLDRLSPASSEDSNLIYNNRSYKLDKQPKENIVQESDVYENRVIHTFLHYSSQFLLDLKEEFTIISKSAEVNFDSEYVRFDHTMEKFTRLAMKHKSRQIDQLLYSVEHLRKVFNKKIPSKVIPGIPPKVTSYVAKHPHYRQTFKLIEQCNHSPAPSFEGSSVLLGLKNLSIVYEIASLLILHDAIQRCFNVNHIEQSYRQHGEEFPFGGKEKDRPYGEVNNLFVYKNDDYNIELFYEPKIFPMSKASEVGDLVDISGVPSSKLYGQHHYCPDFIIKIQSTRWQKPVVIVLDSKYKDSSTVKKFDIAELSQKYLLKIHQVNEFKSLGISPIKLLLILFAHNQNGNYVRTVAARHSLTGDIPVLPQAAGVLVKPSDTLKLDDHLKALIKVIDNEYSISNLT